MWLVGHEDANQCKISPRSYDEDIRKLSKELYRMCTLGVSCQENCNHWSLMYYSK